MYNGELFICGRTKDLIIVRGRNHYPQDIEHSVEADMQLRGGCTAAFSAPPPDAEGGADGGEQLVILAEVRDSKGTDLAALAQAVRLRVSRDHGVTPAVVRLMKPRSVPKVRHPCGCGGAVP